MWVVYSYVKYEGSMFHGIFNSMEKAEKAKNQLKADEFDADDICIEFTPIDTLMFNFGTKYGKQ